MFLQPEHMTHGVDRTRLTRLATRSLWIALRLIAVFYLGRVGQTFFYQGF